MSHTLIACNGMGSAIAEAVLHLAEIPFDLKLLAWEELGPMGDAHLVAANPLGQVPTLILPDGQVMTESAAISLYASETRPEAGLAPPIGHPRRPTFLRLLSFMGTALYAPFTFEDFPERWVDDSDAGKQLKERVLQHRKKLWLYLEEYAQPGPWMMGSECSVLDIYLNVMTRWSPRRDWFGEHCPKLNAIAVRLDQDPRFSAIWQRNFTGNQTE